MRRRDFVRSGLLGGAAIAGGAVPWSQVGAQSGAAIEDAGLLELRGAMEQGEHGSVDLVRAYLARIAELDAAGPRLRSIIEVNPDAERIAAALDRERQAGAVRGPLHGIPIVLKDNIDTGDTMMTSAGSFALADRPAPRDAAVAARLRDAGAVILAKANLSEWANFRSTRSSSGWSARGGQVRNPHVLDRSPCGSSSGSGVAVAASLCAAAIGTETDGSIVCPSSINGVVGVKPTVGLVSRAGIVPISHSQDTAGPMARSVADAAALLSAIAGADPRDPATVDADAHRIDYGAALDAGALRGARLGLARDLMGYHEKVDALVEEAARALRDAGAELVDVELGLDEAIRQAEWLVLQYEFKADMAAYLATRPEQPQRSLADLIAFNEANAAREMPHFGQEIFHASAAKGDLETPEYLEALATCRRVARDEGIDRVLSEHRIEAIVAPTDSPAWPIDLVLGDHFLGGSSTAAAVAGYPSVTVPAGFVSGLPVGLSFFAGAWSEPRLLALAYAYEQATGARRAPGFLPTLPID